MRYLKRSLLGTVKCGLLATAMIAVSAFAQSSAEPAEATPSGFHGLAVELPSGNTVVITVGDGKILDVDILRPPLSSEQAEARYREGLDLARHHDMQDALDAFRDAADSGYGMAARKLGDIYGTGGKDVERDYETSLRWYRRTRDQGIEIPNKPFVYPGVRR